MNQQLELAAAAARLIAEDGLDYAEARRRAAEDAGVGGRGGRRAELPSNEQVEDALREHLAIFHADTQPAELRALRELALRWMERLQAHRPHLAGAAWRGTATRRSALHLDLYCDDPKAAEIALIDLGVDYDAETLPGTGREPVSLLRFAQSSRELGEPVTLLLTLHDADAQRGALRPDARGRSWRGDLAALRRRLADDADAPAGQAGLAVRGASGAPGTPPAR